MTLAPLLRHERAMAYPILPVEAFVIYRTGSIDSCVGPAVMRMFLPTNVLGVSAY